MDIVGHCYGPPLLCVKMMMMFYIMAGIKARLFLRANGIGGGVCNSPLPSVCQTPSTSDNMNFSVLNTLMMLNCFALMHCTYRMGCDYASDVEWLPSDDY